MTRTRTVHGDVPTETLGRVDYHEHLFQRTPLLPGDELTNEVASTEEATRLRASGFETMVDATPLGLGRRPMALAEASRRAGLHVVATTGAHRIEHYRNQSWVTALSVDELIQRFKGDIEVGIPTVDEPGEVTQPSDVRAGVLKIGIGYWRINAFERRVTEAVAVTASRTRMPVMVHTEFATAAHEILDLLEGLDVDLTRVVLAHVDRNPDPGLHTELAARGAKLGYDGAGRAKSAPDSEIIACLASTVDAGYPDAVLLGGDVARATRYVSYGGMPGLEYLGRRFIPRLVEAMGPEHTNHVLTHNPQNWLAIPDT